ncbi:winged helix-turn-helix domain-containing protein [Microbacterium sp.]|uniref:winged helix-turn-helix domain-containing protein n=1 Tax=Microbacterium sp. TaxID=51671 RepID=UPI0039E55676
MAALPAGDTPPTPAMIAVALGVPPMRLELLRAVAHLGSATTSQLARQVGCTRNGLRPHLAILEELGVVRAETQRILGSYRPAKVDLAWNVYDALVSGLGREEVSA